MVDVPSSMFLVFRCEDIESYPTNVGITIQLSNDLFLREIPFPNVDTALDELLYDRATGTWHLPNDSIVSIKEILLRNEATYIHHWPSKTGTTTEIETIEVVKDSWLVRLINASMAVPLVPQSIFTTLVFIGIGFAVPQLVLA